MKGEALFAPRVATFHSTKRCNLSFVVCVFVLQGVSIIQYVSVAFILCHIQLHIVIQNQLFLFMFTRLMSLGWSTPSSGRLLPVSDKDDCAGAR